MASKVSSPSADCYLQFAHELREKCHRLAHIKGARKLERKIIAEVKFLRNLLRRNSKVQESHLKSSNLSHYAAIVHAAENVPGTIEILQPFSCPGKRESLIVDVVACQGHIWVKVIARKAQALHLVWAGQGQFGERDLLRQAEDYLDSAEKHPRNFTTPGVYFVFYNNVTIPMSEALHDKGIQVLGHQVPVDGNVKQKLMHLQDEEEEEEEEAEEFRGPGTGSGPEFGRDSDKEAEEDSSSRIMGASEFLSASDSPRIKSMTSLSKDSLHAESESIENESLKCEQICEGIISESVVTCSVDMMNQEAHNVERGKREMVGGKNSLVEIDGDSVPGVRPVESALHDLSLSSRTDKLCQDIDTCCLSSSSNKKSGEDSGLGYAQERLDTGIREHRGLKHSLQSKQPARVDDGLRSSEIKSLIGLDGGQGQNAPTDSLCGSTPDASSDTHSHSPSNPNTTSHSPTDSHSHSPSNPACGSTPDTPSHSPSNPSSGATPNTPADAPTDSTSPSPSKPPTSPKSSCSPNYTLLMSELLGVIPVLSECIMDSSAHIINGIFKVNLDITTLITLVSAVTHGNCNYVFTEKILTMQAAEEREKPVLPGLLEFMKGKELYACRSAVDDFNTILSTLGGDGEKQRAAELLARVKVVDDKPSQKALNLQNLGKIKDRSKVIFGTGDSLEAITMTANSGFLRAAESQGVTFAVFVHAARALTEDKEKTATLI
ncbi:UPF0415 protein C7orf25 homolog [Haliotis rufescens]|uniref:UPF0415 protein C7orf25 homolog n=1 Tax=Haliotis rufescens TaxID=6454 RepID=UPI00201E97CC|nr:UPF0415 protein C7orf25 homolog [Haliotis rufescens]